MLKGTQDLKRLYNAGWIIAEIEKISDTQSKVLAMRRKRKEVVLVDKSARFLCKYFGVLGYVEYYHDGISQVKSYREVWETPRML